MLFGSTTFYMQSQQTHILIQVVQCTSRPTPLPHLALPCLSFSCSVEHLHLGQSRINEHLRRSFNDHLSRPPRRRQRRRSMPAVAVDHRPNGNGRGLTKPKSKLRLRLGLTPPHPPKKQASPTPLAPPPPPPPAPAAALLSSTSTTASASASATSRADSRSAFTYDNHTVDSSSPSTASFQHDSHSPGFETVSLNTEHANVSRSTLMDPALAQHYYPTPTTTDSTTEGEDAEPVEDDAGLRHPQLRQLVAASDDILCLTDRQLGERFSFVQEIGFGNWGSVWKVRPRHSRASQLGDIRNSHRDSNKPGSRLGRKAAMSGGSGAGGKVAIKLVHRERTAVCLSLSSAVQAVLSHLTELTPHPRRSLPRACERYGAK